MNFLKNALALILAISCMLCSMAFVFSVNALAIGTESNPENANDRYFAAAQSYLINTDLAAGDSDGYWYTFTATGSGILLIDASANDAGGAKTEDFQVTVTCKGVTYKAVDKVFTRPITPFKVSRNDVVTIHMTANPDANGNYPKLKIYCNITTAYGNSSDPILIKSKEGFVANVRSKETLVYQDGTNGGLWGCRGIIITAEDPSFIANTEIVLYDVTYIDVDMDGSIELMLPGDPAAQIATHPVFSIFNGNSGNMSYTIKVVDSAKESAPGSHEHSYRFHETVVLPTVFSEGKDIYRCYQCGVTKEVSVPSLERWGKGDINNDGVVNTVDANLIKRVMVGLIYSAQISDASDMNEDGQVNAVDSSILKRKLSGVN